MTTRTTGETVTFLHPFKLSGFDDIQPAGRYLVETDEERLEGLSFPVYRRLSTFIRKRRPHATFLSAGSAAYTQGRSSSMRFCGWPSTMREMTSVR
jgi:hypothetical protein